MFEFVVFYFQFYRQIFYIYIHIYVMRASKLCQWSIKPIERNSRSWLLLYVAHLVQIAAHTHMRERYSTFSFSQILYYTAYIVDQHSPSAHIKFRQQIRMDEVTESGRGRKQEEQRLYPDVFVCVCNHIDRLMHWANFGPILIRRLIFSPMAHDHSVLFRTRKPLFKYTYERINNRIYIVQSVKFVIFFFILTRIQADKMRPRTLAWPFR